MPKTKKSQHYQFVYQAVPILFHHSRKDFMSLLERDGMKFLRFWWDHTGEETDEAGKQPMEGMAYEFREYKSGERLALLTLPPPRVQPEAFYMALIPPPAQKSFLPWKNFSNVYVLQSFRNKEGQISTRISAVTPRAIIRDMEVSSAPDLESFYQAVLKLL
jgi:hypothetical protein